ncbi:MAG TPA: VOC family protein [Phycisphaerales bacterium]|nr:VOC family protein [Phycisphaerales bacterium]
MASTPPGFRLAFDVTNLDATCAFYRSLAGFETRSVTRQGEIFETRELTSPSYPGVQLFARLAFGKRAAGTSPGTITSIGLPVADLPATIRRLTGQVRWVGPNPESSPDDARDSVSLLDPDAYQIQLYRA